MKKTLLFVSALCLGTSAFAQLDSLPNANFDYWKSGTADSIVGWGNNNKFIFGQYPSGAVAKDTSSTKLGPNTLVLKTVAVGAPVNRNIPGVVISTVAGKEVGSISLVNNKPALKGGFPFRQRPISLTGMAKYLTTGVDTPLVAVALTKYDTVAKKRDTVGIGFLTSKINSTGYQMFSVAIDYSMSKGRAISPDTAYIILSSSSVVGVAGSLFYVDSLAFDYGCTIDPNILSVNGAADQLPVAGDTLKINAGIPYSSTITFYIPSFVDYSGTKVNLDSILLDKTTITASKGLANGTYTVTSNWGNSGKIGTNTIACVTISGILTSPTNGKAEIYVNPKIWLNGSTAPTQLGADTTIVKIGNGSTVGIQNFSVGGSFNVAQNIPNPFDGSTSINFNAVGNGNIDFTVTDVLGRQVYDTNINATLGSNTFVFTTDLANGTYFFSLSDGKNTVTKKMVVTK